MQANKRKDTKPELLLRRELHRRGLRYRVDYPILPGSRRRADIVFPRLRLAVFVDGCSWHGCPKHGTLSRSSTNATYWSNKIATNVERDRDTNERLAAAGWTVLRLWEHEPPLVAADAVDALVQRLSGQRTATRAQSCKWHDSQRPQGNASAAGTAARRRSVRSPSRTAGSPRRAAVARACHELVECEC